jgi:CHASE2 domain-containing protein
VTGAAPQAPRLRTTRLPVTIVEIDEKSIASLGLWPWPRKRLARLLHEINGYAPSAIGLDLVMPDLLTSLPLLDNAARGRGLVSVDDFAYRAAQVQLTRGDIVCEVSDGVSEANAPTLTTNSVPRTPSTADGVCSFIALGDCFAIRPDTTASVPLRNDGSKRPTLAMARGLREIRLGRGGASWQGAR